MTCLNIKALNIYTAYIWDWDICLHWKNINGYILKVRQNFIYLPCILCVSIFYLCVCKVPSLFVIPFYYSNRTFVTCIYLILNSFHFVNKMALNSIFKNHNNNNNNLKIKQAYKIIVWLNIWLSFFFLPANWILNTFIYWFYFLEIYIFSYQSINQYTHSNGLLSNSKFRVL